MKRFISIFMICALAVLLLTSCKTADKSYDAAEKYMGEVQPRSEKSDGVLTLYSLNSSEIQQKLIVNCKIQAETKEFSKTVDAIRSEIAGAGGYVESQESRGSADESYSDRRISMTVRIPAEKLDGFTEKMSGLMNVTSVSSSVENVTEAYYDADARLKTLKTEHDSLLAMMEKLDTAEEYNFWGELFNKISALEQEIASLEATIRNYDNRVNYSTVGIDLYEVRELTEKEEPGFGERIGDAFRTSWSDFADGCREFAVWFVGAIPTLLVLAVVFGGLFCAIFFPVRRAMKKKK